MTANLTCQRRFLAATLNLCEANSTAAGIVRDLCNNWGYLTTIHTATTAWERLSVAPYFRNLRFCIKDYAGNRFVVRPDQVVAEVNARRQFIAIPEGDANRYRAVKEVFLIADDLTELNAVAKSLGWLDGWFAPKSETITLVRK